VDQKRRSESNNPPTIARDKTTGKSPPEHPSEEKKTHLLRRRKARYDDTWATKNPTQHTTHVAHCQVPNSRSSGLRSSAIPKGKRGPKDVALRRGFGYRDQTPLSRRRRRCHSAMRCKPRVAVPSTHTPLCPRGSNTTSARDSRPDTKSVCHRPNLSLRSGFDRTSPHIMTGTGCSRTSIRPSHSIQPSAPRPRFTVQ